MPSVINRFLFVACMIGTLPLLQACTTNPATGEQSFTAFMSEEDEKRIGAEEHPKMLDAFGGTYDDATLQRYVNRIGEDLASYSEFPDLDFQFFVLNDDTVNAFALPGGYIYISRGLIALAEDEAEVAGVIGHEIGHVTARHSAQRYSAAMATNIGLSAVGILGQVLGAPAGVGNAVSFGAQAALQSYSRGQELEADRLGARYMVRAGYDPSALTDFFAKLDAQGKLEAKKAGRTGDGFNIMSTHPRTTDRIQQAAELAARNRPQNPKRNRDPFLAQVDGVLFGKDPREGFMRDDTFIHPVLGFKFDFPPGFKVDNGRTQVTGTDEKGTTVIFDMERPNVATGMPDLRRYLTQHWGPKIGLKALENVETITINGLSAATGSARADTNRGVRDIRLIAIRAARERLYRFVFLTDPRVTVDMSTPLRRTTYSFELITPEDANDLKPPRVNVKRVGPGETIESLAQSMQYNDFGEDWFKALNLNVISDGLAEGERVKVIAAD